MPCNWVTRLSKEDRFQMEAKIVRLKKEEGLTQRVLATRFGVSSNFIHIVWKKHGLTKK
jgi:DNA-binding transcriptional regulator YiaG